MNLQLDLYPPVKDIIVHIANSRLRSEKENRNLRIRQNIAALSPAISSTGWTFRFVEEAGESLNVINDDKFLHDTSYAKELLNFAAAMQLPKEDANPSVIRATDVYNCGRVSLKEVTSKLLSKAKRIFKMLKISGKDLDAVVKTFQGKNAMRSASEIIANDPDYHSQYCNRRRWHFQERALLGTITNWLGDRVALTCGDFDRLRRIGFLRSRFRLIAFSDHEKVFLYELFLVVSHALDTVEYLRNVLKCEKVIDTNHVRYVYHDNGFIPKTLENVLEDVNDLSYTVLLPLFFTKELFVHRSKLLARLRLALVRHRELQERTLSGDFILDSRRMRGLDTKEAQQVREVARIVCISDLLSKDEQHRIRSYGEFPTFQEGEVCALHSGNIRLSHFPSVNHEVGHILNNFGNRLRRTRLDKSLKAKSDNIIMAEGDVLAAHALARQAVVYTSSPVWGADLIGGVEQPILGGFQASRHKLLAFLGLFHLLCNGEEEEDQMQTTILRSSYSTESELLKEFVMEFMERKILARKNRDQNITASEIVACAKFASLNAMDAAVVAREMIHYLVADRGRLIPIIEGAENDGCYFSALYKETQYGSGRMVVNTTIPLAGVSTTQGDVHQLYTKDGRVLRSTVDLRVRSASVTHLSDGGDQQYQHYYPVPVTGNLAVG